MSLFKKIFRKSTNRPTNRKRLTNVESLESRRLLTADFGVIGDSNGDGLFGSSDFVAVFQGGKFESGEEATFAEGDWNGDGFFNTGDFVLAFQGGHYEQPVALAADGVERDPAEGEVLEDDATVDEAEDADGDRDGDRERRRAKHRAGNLRRHLRTHRLLDGLASGIESGDLPGDLTAEEAQSIIDGLNAAIEAGDRDAVGALIDQVRAAQKQDAVQAKIDAIQADLDEATAAGEETLYGLPVADVETAVGTANDAVAADDLGAAKDALQPVTLAKRSADRADRALASVTRKIESLQTALDAATAAGEETLNGLPVADVEAALVAANDAVAAGDAAAAKTALDSVRAAKRAADRADRHMRSVANKVARLQSQLDAATEAGEDNVGGVANAEVEAAIGAANEALAAGDLDAANAALNAIKEAQQEVRSTERVQSVIDAVQGKIDAAKEAGDEAVGDLSIAEAEAAVAAANEALSAGDLDAAKEALSGLTSNSGRGGQRGGGHQAHGRRSGRRG